MRGDSYLSSRNGRLVMCAIVAVVQIFFLEGVAAQLVPLSHAHIDGICRSHWNNDFPERRWLRGFHRRLDSIHIPLSVLGDFISNKQTVQGTAIEQGDESAIVGLQGDGRLHGAKASRRAVEIEI